MFHLFYGNDLRGLARELGEHLRRPCTNVLVPDIVLVPQAGMRRWLEIELAESLGIVANVDFRLPGEFINTLLAAGAGSRPRHGAFDREVLRWRLMPLLAQLASEPVGAPIAHYLRGDAAQLRRQQLAREFAAALERYQAYRRDVLREWEAGGSPHDWQAEAWRRLARTTDEPHRARLIDAFLARYTGSTDAPANLPERLSVFGCLGLSPDALRVLGVLGRHCDVDFYLPSPCIEYWGDERAPRERLRAGASPLEAPAQPLLASWGRVGREVFEQVFSYEEVQPADDVACVREPARTTLLGRIQSDILHLQAPDPDARLEHLDPDDVSLRAHECHSPLREVQVLHDHLLALFERDPTLKPRDIVVMVPDVAAYAPVIDAVFGALPAGDVRRIPYTVADLAAGDEHPVTRLFLTLLSLPVSRWGVSDVLDLLAVPAVMRRHGLDADTLERLGHWFELAGVRWGLDAGTRVAFGAGNYRAFTWAEGIERLLLGYATGNDTESAGIVPVPAVEGSAATALGQALLVLRELEQLATAQRTPRPAASWQALYQHALDALLPDAGADQDERRARALVRGALAALADGAAAGSCDEALDWQCVREFLAERLAEPDPRQRFLGGGVSFCGMVPLRAIPFRVIALLGMDDAAFPRREPANGINRLEQDLRQARRPGDRSVRDDDRYLFLQVLTSAADALHLSWVGRDARTGKRREPSALVGELLRTVRRDYVADAAGLVVAHPLQPFARVTFDGSRAGVFTYRNEWRQAAGSGRSALARPFVPASGLPVPPAGARRLGLQELVEFWRNPSKAFLRGTLHLQVDQVDAGAEDEDALVLDGLGRSRLARSLVEHGLASGNPLPAEPDAAARVRFQLPVGLAGREAWQSAVQCAAPVVARVAGWMSRSHPLAPAAFELTLPGGWILDCALPRPCREGLLHWSASRLQGRNWLQPWIEHLALCAWPGRRQAGIADDAGCLRIGWREGEVEVVTLPCMDPADAREELEALLQGWQEGQAAPLPFFPRAAWSHALVLARNPEAEETDPAALKAARGEYEESERSFGESQDPWIALAFRDRDPLSDGELAARFRQQAMRVFGTLARLVQAGAA